MVFNRPIDFNNNTQLVVVVVDYKNLQNSYINDCYTERVELQPLEYRGKVIIGVDPSKANCSALIEDAFGDILFSIEVKGGGSERRLSDFTYLLSRIYYTLFKELDIHAFSQEQVIVAKHTKDLRSMMILNEVRVCINMIANGLEMLCKEINNLTWKSELLPKGKYPRNVKGSQLEYEHLFALYPFGRVSDDVTDAYCVAEYTRRHSEVALIRLDEGTRKHVSYPRGFVVVDSTLHDVSQFEIRMVYNSDYSLLENVGLFSAVTDKQGATRIGSINNVLEILEAKMCLVTEQTKANDLYLIVEGVV